jgi:hypothetical protein
VIVCDRDDDIGPRLCQHLADAAESRFHRVEILFVGAIAVPEYSGIMRRRDGGNELGHVILSAFLERLSTWAAAHDAAFDEFEYIQCGNF